MPGAFKTPIFNFAASPERGLICISRLSGIATDIPVGIRAEVFGKILIGSLIKVKAFKKKDYR